MKQGLKLFIAVALTGIVTVAATGYFVRKAVIKSYVNAVSEMETFNEVHRIHKWDRLEDFLGKGCNKEALELVKIEQASALSSLGYYVGNNINLKNKIRETEPELLKRVDNRSRSDRYVIPTCK